MKVDPYPHTAISRYGWRWVACAVLLAIHALPASGNELPEFRSRAYRISSDLPRETVIEIAKHMDLVYAEYDLRFRGFRSRTPAVHDLYVFGKQADYMEFLRDRGVNGAGAAGMFFVNPSGSGLAAFLEDAALEKMLQTLRHEGFHQFAYNRIGPELPIWVNEGLADYFSAAIIVKGRIEPGQVPVDRLIRVRSALSEGRALPLQTLLAMTSDEWSQRVRRGEGGMQYAQSWSIVHFLVHGDRQRYQEAFTNYLHLVSRGTPSHAAFRRAFGDNSEDAFRQRWEGYITQIEPTAEYAAAQRLEFLARGLEMLRERGVQPRSMDEIKTHLQKARFYVRYTSSTGEVIELNATDEANYQAPTPTAVRGQKGKSTIELIADPEGELPPSLVVKGLRVPVRLSWSTDGEGHLMSRVVYE